MKPGEPALGERESSAPESAPPASGVPPESRRLLEANAKLLIRAEHDLHKLEDRYRRESKKLAAVLAAAWRLRDLPGDALFEHALALFVSELDHDRGLVLAPLGDEYRRAASVGFEPALVARHTQDLCREDVERIGSDRARASALLAELGLEQGLAGVVSYGEGPLLFVVGRSDRLAPFLDPLDDADRRLFDLLLMHVAAQLENQALVARISAENKKLMAANAAAVERMRELDATRRHVEQAGHAAALGGFLEEALGRYREPLEALASELRRLEHGTAALLAAHESMSGSYARRVPTAFAEIAALESRYDLARWASDLPRAAEQARARVASLVEMTMATERIAGRSGEELRRIDVAATVSDVLAVAGDAVRRRATLELAVGTVPAVRGNPGRIAHVLLQLLANAVEALPEAADAGRSTRNVVRLATELANGLVVLAVEDNGRGIDPAVGERVFEPFFTTKSARGALGLGLTVARRIVEAHRGTIGVETRRGFTRFEVTLPAAPPSRAR